MTHALDGIVVQLAVRCPYLFDIAGLEGLTQGATQSFDIGRVHVYDLAAPLESEVRSGEVVLAGDVDEGPPFWVAEVYARLAVCRRYQVAHCLIVLDSLQHPRSEEKVRPLGIPLGDLGPSGSRPRALVLLGKTYPAHHAPGVEVARELA